MAEDYAKVKSQLDDENTEEEQAVKNAVSKHKGSIASRIFNKGATAGANLLKSTADAGTKALAGGMAAIQSLSATSIAAILGVSVGLGSGLAGGEDMAIQYRDDTTTANEYQCVDNYSDAYSSVFGTLDEQPLPEYNNAVLRRLQEINEWSKEYVGQSIPDKLVCDEPDCPYYGHEGCTDPDHKVKQVKDGTYAYTQSGARIDLANVKRIHDFFSEYGLTDVQIAAICGVMTVESHIDFTSVENYNIQGERYNLDPSAVTSEFGFKPWAEGLGSSPITTATCIHQISANEQPGPEDAIDYGAYSADHSAIWKLGIGIVGFTDGPGFQLNTYLRNYADYINDRVTLIQRLVEGAKGWQNTLRRLAADKYHIAYGASGNTIRGTATNYVEPVEGLLTLKYSGSSTGYLYKKAYEEYIVADKELKEAVDTYNELAQQYLNAANAIRNNNWTYHGYEESDPEGTVYKITFEKHDLPTEHVCYTTDYTSGNYVTICIPEELKKCDKSDETISYIEYAGQNDTDVVYPQMEPVYKEDPKGSLTKFTLLCYCPPDPGPEPVLNPQEVADAAAAAAAAAAAGGADSDAISKAASDAAAAVVAAFNAKHAEWAGKKAAHDAGVKEHGEAAGLIAKANSLVDSVKKAWEDEQAKKKVYDEKLAQFNKASQAHAMSVVQFYNALHDYYLAADFDMESMIRDAAFRDTSIYDETKFYTATAYSYTFNARIDGQPLSFRQIFKGLYGDDDVLTPNHSDKEDDPTVSELRLYYELWQNYAKYATNLPQNGKYINWWTPEVQLLYLVGGSYKADLGRGIKVRNKYKLSGDPDNCPICSANITTYDEAGQSYYNWMSTWKGDDYTGRDIATATKNFFHDMISGGFDDGSLQLRTEYAYAYYYMFQYGTPYQQAIAYTSAGSEAADIMEEMISEGRWQVNTSNTLSDTAMPHNDKWREYQTASITRQWDIDTSTAMSHSLLSILGKNQARSKVNLLENIWNGCRYINIIDNSTIGNAAIYLTDNPLIYRPSNDPDYRTKYGTGENSATEPVSSLYKVVYNVINRRLSDNGKSTMGSDDMMTDGFTFVKTAVLWSGLDKEFENINSLQELKNYLRESTSSIWQNSEIYQNDQTIGRGNSHIWEQRKLGPYYDESGSPYYKYKWYLVSRVLHKTSSNTGTKWYDDLREDGADASDGDVIEDLDSWDEHKVDEHDTANAPSIAKGYASNGYEREANENGKMADWVRVDWECWDPECEICHGKGGHGNTDLLLPGDIIVGPKSAGIWLGEDVVQAMYPLEKNELEKLVYVGGEEAQRLKSLNDKTGFTWSAPCDDYVNHDTVCKHTEPIPSASPSSDLSCVPYNPDGKWTVYRLILSNYTDDYRSAGISRSFDSDDWEIWYKYRYKGMAASADTRIYLEEVRKTLRSN